MKFLSMDIETTGLDESYCQILEIGAVLGDLTTTPVDDLPFFNRRLYFDKVIGEPYALNLNYKLVGDMANRVSMPGFFEYIHPDSVWSHLTAWLESNGVQLYEKNKITVAGKNFASFDRRFLVKLPRWNASSFHHRTIDPGNLFWLPESDTVLPDTKECISRAGLDWDSKLLHSAVADARLVVELVRAGTKFREPRFH